MEYSSFNSNKKSRRKVDPCYIYNWKGEFYFVGWCHKRKAFRDFFIGRIDDLEITSIKATNHDFNADTYFSDKLWGILKGGEEVKVKFKVKEDRVAWVNERFGDRIEKIDERDDWVFFSVDVVVNKDFVKWVLGWGEDIMVLSPTAVQERLVDYCKGVLGLYDKVSRKDT